MKIAEQRIREAIEKGEFNNLSGAGKPLKLEDDTRIPEDLRMVYRVLLKRKGVTLQLLWEEYSAAHPGSAYRYSQFCVHYHRFRDSLKRSMRQIHRAGEKLFIDYSGDTEVPIIQADTGEFRYAECRCALKFDCSAR